MLFQIIEYYANNCEKGIKNVWRKYDFCVTAMMRSIMGIFIYNIYIYKISTYCIYLILDVGRVRI